MSDPRRPDDPRPAPDRHGGCGDAAAYVLGALDLQEAEAFRRHLESCVICRDEVAAFERVANVLPASVPQYRAPVSLRRRVLQEVHAGAPGQPEAQTGRPRARRLARWLALTPRPVLAGAGALAAAVIALAVALALSGPGGPRVVTAQVTGPGSAQVRLLGGGHAELVLRHFPTPPPGDVYEVWLQRGNRAPEPTRTLFGVTSSGDADVGVDGHLTGVSRMMVTPEPAGGSRAPTHAPVIVARID